MKTTKKVGKRLRARAVSGADRRRAGCEEGLVTSGLIAGEKSDQLGAGRGG